MRSLRSGLVVLVAAASCALAAATERRPVSASHAPTAASGDPWRAIADPVFKVAARDDAIPEAGLPRAVAQDGNGFLWLATDAGLARWDGTGFKTYGTEASPGAGALPEPMVNTLFADRDGTLWLGMSAEGLLWHDATSERFVRPPNRTALDHAHVLAIADDGRGGLWVGSDIGLAHVRNTNHRATILAEATLPPGSVHAVHVDGAGTLWVASGSRLLRRGPADTRFAAVDLGVHPLDGAIMALHADETGRLWVATAANGLFVVAPGGGIRHLPIRIDGAAPVLGAIVDAGDGTLWIASRSGIWIVDRTSLHVRRLAHDPQLPASLPEDGLNHLLRDRAGMIWVVGDSALAYVDPSPRRVLAIVGALRSDTAHVPDAAWSVGAGPDGAIWYGSADAPAVRLLPVGNGAGVPMRRLPGARRNVQAFAFRPTGEAFTAGEDGLFLLSRNARDARRLSARPWSRLLLRGDTLYVGGNGIGIVDVRHPGAPVPSRWSAALTDPRVRSLAVTTDGSLWVGTAAGLNRVDPATGSVTRIRPSPGNAIGLKANFVGTLLGDRQGRLWAGTIGGGITIFAPTAGSWHAVAQLGRREGLPHDTIDKLLPGRDGAIWASTDGGIARIDPTRLTITTLRAADGVAFPANWTGAGDVLPDGRLVFAGFGGLTLVDPAAPPRDRHDAPLRFTAVRGGGQAFVPSTAAPMLTIGARDRSLTAEFARLDFAGARDQAYAYRLFPSEREWTRVDAAHRVARYTNLPPGRSRLEVRALESLPSGAMRAAGAPLLLELEVERRWSETWLVRGAALAFAALVVFGLIHLRLRAARKRERRLERIVERRTAELLLSRSELEKLAYTDTLTGLGNRRLYGEVLGRHLSQATMQAVALLLIDLDRFKQVNDELGHDVGDALLVEVADRLTTTIRQRDSIFRLGGDEFAILLTGLDTPQAIDEICRRLYAAIKTPVQAGSHRLHVALSIGAVVARAGGATVEAIYKHADLALYEAKHAGRGTWRLSSMTG